MFMEPSGSCGETAQPCRQHNQSPARIDPGGRVRDDLRGHCDAVGFPPLKPDVVTCASHFAALGRLRQEDCKDKANLGYREISRPP